MAKKRKSNKPTEFCWRCQMGVYDRDASHIFEGECIQALGGALRAVLDQLEREEALAVEMTGA